MAGSAQSKSPSQARVSPSRPIRRRNSLTHAVLGVDPDPGDGDDDHGDRLGQEQRHAVAGDAADADARQERRQQQADGDGQDGVEEDEDEGTDERRVEIGVGQDLDVVVQSHRLRLADAPPLGERDPDGLDERARCRRSGRAMKRRGDVEVADEARLARGSTRASREPRHRSRCYRLAWNSAQSPGPRSRTPRP